MATDNSVMDADSLNQAEETGAGAAEGGLYRDEGKGGGSLGQRLKKLASSGGRKKLIGGGVVGGGIASVVVSLLMLAPLKILHIVNNIQAQFGAAAEQATEDMTDRFLRAYLVKKVMPGMIDGKCSSTRVTNKCVKVTPGDGPIALLYNGWRDAKIEQSLAKKHGIVIERNGNKFKLITPSTLKAGGIDLGDFDGSNTNNMDKSLYKAMSRSDVRREVRKATEGETFAKRLMYRYKYGRYIERKHGIARCVLACNLKDRFSNNIEAKKAAFKSYFVKRVVLPRSEMMGVAMLCAINGFTCTDAPEEPDAEGRKVSQAEKDSLKIVEASTARAREAGDLERVHDEAKEINKEGFTSYIIKKVLPGTLGKITAKAVPWVGWIDLAARVYQGAEKAGEAAKKLNFIINSAAMITTYSMFRSQADEMKTGNIDAYAQGSMVNAFDATDGTERKDQGGVGAEQTPLYQALMGSGSTEVGWLGIPKASAANEYKCDDGKPVPEGELVCPEESLINSRGVAKGADVISDIANSPILKSTVGVAADIWLNTIGLLFDKVAGVIGDVAAPILKGMIDLLPGNVKDAIAGLISSIADYFMSYLINNPISDDPSGGRMFDLAVGGGDAALNDFTHYNLGAAAASEEAVNKIREDRYQDRLTDFKEESMFARVFDTSSQFSVMSRLALAMPGGGPTAIQNGLASLINPSSLLGGLGRIGAVGAAQLPKDPFGITQYAYDPSDAVFNDDPEATWEANDCSNPDQVKDWGRKSQPNSETGMEEHTETNPCLLLKSAAGSAGGLFNDKLLEDELGNGDGTSGDSLQTGQLCTVGNKALDEASGLAASLQHKGIVYTENDEGNKVYALDENTCEIKGIFSVSGTRKDPDPEAMTLDHSTGKVWFGDIGNGHPDQPFSDKKRALKYPDIPARIIVFSEPSSFGGSVSGQTYDITYEGGNQNSEALLADPKTGQGYIISKGPQSKVFKLPYPLKSGQAKDTGVRIPGWVTDATFTNDGKYVLVRYRTEKDASPTNVYVYDKTWKKVGDIPVPKMEQGESITMDQTGPYFLLGSEGVPSPLVRVALPVEFGGKPVSTNTDSSGGTKGKLDLADWKLTLPIGSGGSAKEIKQPQLASYNDEWYHPAADGSGQEFYVDSAKATGTTSNSSNPRSELREMTSGGKSNAAWSSGSGTHRMLIRQKVTALSGRSHVVIGQIHDAEDDVTVFRLEKDQLYITDGDNTHGHLLGTVKLNQVITVGFDVSGGTVRYYYSPTGAANPPVVSNYSQKKNFSGGYFKAGDYCQCSKEKGGGTARVVIMGLAVTHNGKMPAIASLGTTDDTKSLAQGSRFSFSTMTGSVASCSGVVPRLFSSLGFLPVAKTSGGCS